MSAAVDEDYEDEDYEDEDEDDKDVFIRCIHEKRKVRLTFHAKEYGESTVVNMTAPDGEKVRLWLNGAALQQFKRRVASWEEKTEEHPNGIQFPIKISFRMEKAQSQKDESRVYNKLKIVTVGTGEDVKRELETL